RHRRLPARNQWPCRQTRRQDQDVTSDFKKPDVKTDTSSLTLSRHPPREFRIKSMARQPDNKSADKSAANFKSDDSALIRELALLLDEPSLTEIEIERSGLRVRVARNISVSAAMPANYPPAFSASAAASAA